jgi:hypothetical protein
MMFDFAVSYTQGATGLTPQYLDDNSVLFETVPEGYSLGIMTVGDTACATLVVPRERLGALNINRDKLWLVVTRPSDGAYSCIKITHFILFEEDLHLSVELDDTLSGMLEATLDILIAALMRA